MWEKKERMEDDKKDFGQERPPNNHCKQWQSVLYCHVGILPRPQSNKDDGADDAKRVWVLVHNETKEKSFKSLSKLQSQLQEADVDLSSAM